MSDPGQWGGREFEYRLVSAECELDAQFDRLGQDGWELVTITQRDGDETLVLKKETPEPETIVDSEDV